MTRLHVPLQVRRRKVIDTCSFCGRSEAAAGRLILGRSALICGDCVREAAALIAELPAGPDGPGDSSS